MTEVAVVIPTRHRETRLAFALEALAAQTLERDRFEVIVVRAGDALQGPLAKAPAGLTVRFLSSAQGGTAAMRNLGWRAAEAPLVAFTDDDCRPAPDWLERLLEAGADDGILQGRTEPDPDERWLLKGTIARTIEIPEASGWYETCNIAYPRDLLERLGGFDEAFEFLGEDADLGLRAREAGAGFSFARDAVVWHAVYWRNLAQALRDVHRRRSMPALVARYPDQRRHLWLGVFTKRDHMRLLVALAGLVYARRAPWLAALIAYPYMEQSFNPRGLSAWRLARLPSLVLSRAAVDGAEILLFAASSLRHRTLVL